ncbi:cytochrome d ubiquinol oxidase subunit II [Massilia horti]|uniref:Cytochrome d ubiquinol oxidase subunit II n=1 Tax=Massilia horti TaxID=2562153 RepID=A0A4Y9SPG5_9BURK|nr:cytochrome d ubiquinol oxidase subunit II [Massilia horti]TFW28441.1 cytochrome d ubiquinol oxidase subunit II [Massilia horti]
MGLDIAPLWAVIIFFGVFMYVVLDGFDLGIGMLFPFVKEKHERDVMMNTVAPVWDGNETWLVLGGAGMLAAFPLAYSIILSGLYLPLIFMLLGLIFRGVAFEFRFKANERERPVWDASFICGSYVATFFQGVALGTFLEGIPVSGRSYVGGPLDWAGPFPFLAGIGVIITYLVLGSTWLVMKTEGTLHERMIHIARPASVLLFLAIVAVSIWSPIRYPLVAARWFSFPNIVFLAPVPLLVIIFTVLLQRSLSRAPLRVPFVSALALVFLGYTGMAISIWPHIVPPTITIWEASSSPSSQAFTLIGALFVLPIILTYTIWSYYIFRGKVRPGEGYH